MLICVDLIPLQAVWGLLETPFLDFHRGREQREQAAYLIGSIQADRLHTHNLNFTLKYETISAFGQESPAPNWLKNRHHFPIVKNPKPTLN